ncbi:MAG: hypothetical protein CME55_04530 [Halieaceae bacterium]|nr:hypothetical protein [Halieaceae bacterium]|tara:strand:+ start:6574 stop:6792 length:219 start_codon:yes stop_codon:yes gene_type:complete
MGIIFNDSQDAQVESLMKNTHLGTTWAMRYLRIKYAFWSLIITSTGVVVTAVTDYAIYKASGHAGIIGWILG